VTPKRIEELDALSQKATPGPWRAEPKRLMINEQRGPIMSYLAGNSTSGEGLTVSLGSERIADHKFVAALRNAWPELRDLALDGLRLRQKYRHRFFTPQKTEDDPHMEQCVSCGFNLRDPIHDIDGYLVTYEDYADLERKLTAANAALREAREAMALAQAACPQPVTGAWEILAKALHRLDPEYREAIERAEKARGK